MWLEANSDTFKIIQEGFIKLPVEHSCLYVSPETKKLTSIRDLAVSEYAQAIEINQVTKTISFGRDYLGHYPLLYATVETKIFISDSFKKVIDWLKSQNIHLTLSQEAMALYFTM